jgi:hypothetical protein
MSTRQQHRLDDVEHTTRGSGGLNVLTFCATDDPRPDEPHHFTDEAALTAHVESLPEEDYTVIIRYDEDMG